MAEKYFFFRFEPKDFFECLIMSNEEAGSRFKELIIRLTKNEAPEGTPEAKMIAHSRKRSEINRERVMKRWHPEDIQEQPQQSPPYQNSPKMPKKIPDMADVYEYADAIGIFPPIAKEWFEWQEQQGWNNIKTQWQTCLRKFAEKKQGA